MRPGKLVSTFGYRSVSDSARQIYSGDKSYEILMFLNDSVRCVDGNVRPSNEYSSVSSTSSTSVTVSIENKQCDVTL